MNLSSHLIVNAGGSVRVTKGRAALAADEIAIRIDLEIPNSFFDRPYPVLRLVLPDVAQPAPMEVVVDRTAFTVAEALKVDVGQVRDGLTEAIAAAQAERGGDE